MKEGIKRANRFLGTWALVICGIVLVVAAGAHRLQLHTAAPKPYTSSPLIAIEMTLIPIMCLILLMHFVRSIYLILKKRWRDLGMLAINTIVGVGCIIAAMQIDAPTLIYMT
jgi:hypothetical protein